MVEEDQERQEGDKSVAEDSVCHTDICLAVFVAVYALAFRPLEGKVKKHHWP